MNSSGFDIRVVSWGDGSGVPVSGSKLVVVGLDDDDLLHIRIFDRDGDVLDADEARRPWVSADIATFKARLPGLAPPHAPTDEEEWQAVQAARRIVGIGLMNLKYWGLKEYRHADDPAKSCATR